MKRLIKRGSEILAADVRRTKEGDWLATDGKTSWRRDSPEEACDALAGVDVAPSEATTIGWRRPQPR